MPIVFQFLQPELVNITGYDYEVTRTKLFWGFFKPGHKTQING